MLRVKRRNRKRTEGSDKRKKIRHTTEKEGQKGKGVHNAETCSQGGRTGREREHGKK